MAADCTCGSPDHHCRWCGTHKVIPQLARDHETTCLARPQEA